MAHHGRHLERVASQGANHHQAAVVIAGDGMHGHRKVRAVKVRVPRVQVGVGVEDGNGRKGSTIQRFE